MLAPARFVAAALARLGTARRDDADDFCFIFIPIGMCNQKDVDAIDQAKSFAIEARRLQVDQTL
jgi:hypothetical protein